MSAGSARAAKETTSLFIATATTGGTYYPIGIGMASLWSIKLAKGLSPQVADMANFVSFWPNQVLVSLVALAVLFAVLLPQKLAARKSPR
jgi:CBS domain containing-hemolysin-like protein